MENINKQQTAKTMSSSSSLIQVIQFLIKNLEVNELMANTQQTIIDEEILNQKEASFNQTNFQQNL